MCGRTYGELSSHVTVPGNGTLYLDAPIGFHYSIAISLQLTEFVSVRLLMNMANGELVC